MVSEDQLADKEKARTGEGMSADEVAHEPGAALREAESERQGRAPNPEGPSGQGDYGGGDGAKAGGNHNGTDGSYNVANGANGKPEQASLACYLLFWAHECTVTCFLTCLANKSSCEGHHLAVGVYMSGNIANVVQ